MKVTIVHDPAGEILAILRAEPLPKNTKLKVSFGIDPGPGQLVSNFELAGAMAKKHLSEIHEAHYFDVKAKKLVRRSSQA